MPVSDRLRDYCKRNKITQESLVIKGFGTKQTVNNYINGKTEPKAGFLEKFIKEFRLSASWLMTGEGEVYNNSSSTNDKNVCLECIEKQKKLDELRDKLTDIQDKYMNCLEELLDKKGNSTSHSA